MAQIDEIASKDFMDYSMEVLKQRALPSVEDGCKPIHRRILFGMKNGGYLSNKPTRKCAKVVGEILGRYHPHGDSSVYEALVRLAQPWKMRYPLVEIQGNMGNILGDKAAASRYTECRLTPIGELMTKDINKNAVPMTLNYSGEENEPTVLPSAFPNSLVNANLGIAVGMSSTTVCHNLNEVIDALVYLIENGNITTEEMLGFIKGPDFPTGGTIINGEEIEAAYKTGKGSIKLRSKYRIEKINGRQTIIITEVPYLISAEDKIYKKIQSMVVDDGYQFIENIQNNTGKNGFEIRVICKKDANVNRVLKDLCEKTGFQATISMNNTVLVNGLPKFIPFADMLKEYVKFRHQVITNIAAYDKEKAELKLHILNGILIALNDIDAVINIIKQSADRADAKNKLVAKYGFSDIQVKEILDTKLSKLTHLEKEEIEVEIDTLKGNIQYFTQIITNENNTRNNLLIEELRTIQKKYGDARRTEIISLNKTTVAPEDIKTYVYLTTDNNNIFPVEMSDKTLLTKVDGYNKSIKITGGFIANNNNDLIIMTTDGKMIKDSTMNLEIGQYNPLAIDNIAAIIVKQDKPYIVTVSKKGIVKKSLSTEYTKFKNNSAGVKLKADDEIIYANYADKNDFVLVLGSKGNLVKVAIEDITTTGRNTIGSKIISDSVADVAIGNDNDYVITVTDDGKAKYTYIKDFNTTAKGSNGQTVADNTTVIRKVSNKVCYIIDGNKMYRYDDQALAFKGKTAMGAKIGEMQKLRLIM